MTIFAISGFLDGDIWPWDDQLAFAFQHTTVPHATLSVGDQRLSVEIPNRERRLEQLERVRNLCKVIPNDQIYDVVKKISYALHVDIPTAAPPEGGYVLVCPSTDPAWVPLFVHAKALVMETGGVLSHGAIVAREFGLPAVAGLPTATRHIKTGQVLRVDGARGTVTVQAEG